ncbi:MAG: undecaprenyl-diphosphatase UppP [Chloroherpetonaceae bacterium]|nr:undecaprenyl-diphosphatase UppP [Chloroherpetonaceae bacterium]
MSIWQAIILGIIQGLTEFLPISSTAHLRIIPAILGWDDPGSAFTAVIQIGTLGAVFIYFWKDILTIGTASLQGVAKRNLFYNQDATLGFMIVIGTIPIVLAGLLFKKQIDTTLRSLYIISSALIVLALLLWLAEQLLAKKLKAGVELKSLASLDWKTGFLIGLAQCIALIPGSSRSGVTITAGLYLGLSRETAARYSFLLSLPSVFAAGIYQLYKERESLLHSSENITALVIATVVSGVVGYLSIAFLIQFLKTRTTLVFVGYRLFIGFGLLILLSFGTLQP